MLEELNLMVEVKQRTCMSYFLDTRNYYVTTLKLQLHEHS